jgi:hypothetical protein
MNDNEFDDIDIIDSATGNLPNATAVLVLGILSIVTCFLYGIPGLVMGIIALYLHKSDRELYQRDPNRYAQSYQNSNAGKICAIIGVSLSGLFLLYIIMALGMAMSGPFFYR